MEVPKLTLTALFALLKYDDIEEIKAKMWEEKKKKLWSVTIPRRGVLFNNKKVIVSAPTKEEAAIKIFRHDGLSFIGLFSEIRASIQGNDVIIRVDEDPSSRVIGHLLYNELHTTIEKKDLESAIKETYESPEVISDEELLSIIKDSWCGENLEKWIIPFSEVG